MHRFIINAPQGLLVDHINHDTLDNRKANLRLATPQQNVWNSRSGVNTGASRYKGVTWDKTRKRWRVRIKHNGHNLSFGYHKDQIEAAKAYDKAIKSLRGEYAYLNFPEDTTRPE